MICLIKVAQSLFFILKDGKSLSSIFIRSSLYCSWATFLFQLAYDLDFWYFILHRCLISNLQLFCYDDRIKGNSIIGFVLRLKSFIYRCRIHDAALGVACKNSSDVGSMICNQNLVFVLGDAA